MAPAPWPTDPLPLRNLFGHSRGRTMTTRVHAPGSVIPVSSTHFSSAQTRQYSVRQSLGRRWLTVNRAFGPRVPDLPDGMRRFQGFSISGPVR